MKKVVLLVTTVACLALLQSVFAGLGETQGSSYSGSKEFERIKNLAGIWEGTSNMGKEAQKVRVEYRSTAGGSAMVETLFPGTPEEMISVYYDREGRLVMTHYCMLQNQPHMRLDRSALDRLDFLFSEGGNIDPAKDSHMHALTLSFPDKNRLIQKWTFFEDGKEKGVTVLTLTRIE